MNMDPFSLNRPQPTQTHRRCTYRQGYQIIPETLEITPGPKGYDNSCRVPHTITNRFNHLDRVFADPAINGNVYPKHLVYRRKNGDNHVLPSKSLKPGTTPNLRIMHQTALYANMVLRYYGYYVERLPGGDITFPEYGYRVRQVEVYYHMDDDTISVFEPHLENSGLPQDNFGRSEEPRVDPVWEKAQARRKAFKPQDAQNKIEESTTMHRKVYHLQVKPEDKLLFVGIVDDTMCPMARLRPVVVEQHSVSDPNFSISSPTTALCGNVVHADIVDQLQLVATDKSNAKYYLVDETMKIVEFRIGNDAHQFGSALNTVIRRGRIPMGIVEQNMQFGLGPFHKPYITEFYNPTDLVVGNTLFLYGQKILLVEANEWSRKWLKEKLGVEMGPNVAWREKYERRPRQTSRNLVVPNCTGYGSYDDSMKSVLEIDPRIRCPNELSELCNSQDIIKFGARLYSRHPDAHIPAYSILYYVSDDTMAVFEHTVTGDASYGRKFFARQRCPLPEYQGDPFQRTPFPTPCYDYTHLIPGNILTIAGTRFLLTVPDVHIYDVLERHPLLFSCEQKELIKQATEDESVKSPEPLPRVTDEELQAQVMPRAAKLMQRIKYWILYNPSFLMLLLSANDDENLCIMTAGLLEDVCKAGKVECDPFSAAEVYNRARSYYNRIEDQLLYVDEFIRYVFQHGKGVKQCHAELNPRGPDPLLKFRLDLHTG
ncbi:putative EF-hand domain-containing protein 1 [Hypsibius exemplaris]|uniref:EF-hand domain-containing protein 1 n=1 Tax=Hypsibius exemplaris TaxID=2072580 RepID=A0A1W0WCH1_HYPEX|nr:putative EF-hand domain-containing protein 1 [Hypsibius exemplaris]